MINCEIVVWDSDEFSENPIGYCRGSGQWCEYDGDFDKCKYNFPVIKGGKDMAKVVVTTDAKVFIHHFMTKGEAMAYVLGIREANSTNINDRIIKIKLDGRRV